MRTFLFIFLTTTLLISCAPADATSPPATFAPSETPLPSATFVWFPASATPTLPAGFATQTATPQMNPGIGDILLTDDFSDAELWDVAASDQGSAAVSRNRLTIVVQPGFYLASMRRSLLTENFYAEIAAQTHLCRADDNYGLIVRAQGTSFYRFVLSCNGLVHVERINNGTKLIIFDSVPSGDAPLGAPGQVKIGIWAVGAEMRFFLNDRFQFSVVDKSFPSGGFGMFARAVGDTPVTVTFSDLIVYDVGYVFPTRTPSP
ncbi:MAG: hypothetical protein IT314_14885 [Anaerolineales bacterium]|nr:hypothetical protein [Anaerolineales bacterium]